MNGSTQALLPFYLVVDVSWSMSLEGKVEAASRLVPEIIDALAGDPATSANIRFGLIDFSDDARIRLPLRRLPAMSAATPKLTVRAGTSFRSVFTLLRKSISADMARLETGCEWVQSPTIFFLTDGEPTDDDRAWRSAFVSLISQRSRPRVVPCGVGQATLRMMSTLVHPTSGREGGTVYMMDRTYPPAHAITAFAEIVIASMLASSRRSDGRTVLPTTHGVPSGLTRHRIDDWPRSTWQNTGWGEGYEDPSEMMCPTGSLGSRNGGAHGTMVRCRTQSSSGARRNSLNYAPTSPRRPTGSPKQ
jgi:uncharacterized protein YegL